MIEDVPFLNPAWEHPDARRNRLCNGGTAVAVAVEGSGDGGSGEGSGVWAGEEGQMLDYETSLPDGFCDDMEDVDRWETYRANDNGQ